MVQGSSHDYFSPLTSPALQPQVAEVSPSATSFALPTNSSVGGTMSGRTRRSPSIAPGRASGSSKHGVPRPSPQGGSQPRRSRSQNSQPKMGQNYDNQPPPPHPHPQQHPHPYPHQNIPLRSLYLHGQQHPQLQQGAYGPSSDSHAQVYDVEGHIEDNGFDPSHIEFSMVSPSMSPTMSSEGFSIQESRRQSLSRCVDTLSGHGDASAFEYGSNRPSARSGGAVPSKGRPSKSRTQAGSIVYNASNTATSSGASVDNLNCNGPVPVTPASLMKMEHLSAPGVHATMVSLLSESNGAIHGDAPGSHAHPTHDQMPPPRGVPSKGTSGDTKPLSSRRSQESLRGFSGSSASKSETGSTENLGPARSNQQEVAVSPSQSLTELSPTLGEAAQYGPTQSASSASRFKSPALKPVMSVQEGSKRILSEEDMKRLAEKSNYQNMLDGEGG
jgi:hypothetical protein